MRALIPFVSGLFLVLSSCDLREDRLTVFQKISDDVLTNGRAYQTLEFATSEIGHRLTGSESGAESEEYALNLFKEYGYENARFHEFEVEAWSRESVSMVVTEKREFEIDIDLDVVSLAHSPVQASITAEIVDVGNGLEADFEKAGDKLVGKIALANIGVLPKGSGLSNLHRSEKTALAIQYGAAAIVLINKVPGRVLLTGTASVTGDLISIPAVSISFEDGEMLRERMSNLLDKTPLVAKIEMVNKSEKIKARNIIASLEGSELPDERIIMGGHHDSWDLSTGAIDNGIGTFAIMDMARTLKKLNLQPKRSIDFILWMGEEQGLLGSKAYVESLKESGDLDQVRYYLNIDMAGNPIGINMSGWQQLEPELYEAGLEIQQIDTLYKNEIRNGVGLHSDHQVFMMEGIPTLSLVSNLDPFVYKFYHSNGDDFHLVDRDHLNNTVRFTSMLLYALANTDEALPDPLSFEATGQFFEDHDLKEKLILGKEWRWD